ncbi:hypothetical protein D3C84_994230 [compost metagenome]
MQAERQVAQAQGATGACVIGRVKGQQAASEQGPVEVVHRLTTLHWIAISDGQAGSRGNQAALVIQRLADADGQSLVGAHGTGLVAEGVERQAHGTPFKALVGTLGGAVVEYAGNHAQRSRAAHQSALVVERIPQHQLDIA